MKGEQESIERIHRTKKTNWEDQKEMVRYSGQGS